ncbi:MAG: undecaprenyldiphospho-muramoylpentapeptide beta-N-acetylglucosaminyltransferase [Acidobacteria bacterium]|nr:undecaprenyldiphospho-muramoylpentapeptide beta-N-acetylglucosaminyltransferase [Acidobacteriota bacterium]
MSVLIAGGGTGGHLYPGIAVARELLARVPDAHVTFVGTAAGVEARVVPGEGFELDVIRSAGLKGKSAQSLARGVALLPVSAGDAWRVITRRRPAVVVGVGGYSSGPVVLLAALRGIPTLLMEQNAMPGITNRLLAPVVDAAAVTYQESVRFFGSKALVSGNPVRSEFFDPGGPTASGYQDEEAHGHDAGTPSRLTRDGGPAVRPPGAARVLVFGGSQGAHAINVAMVEAAARLAAATPRVAITHQTGERDLEMVRGGYRRAGLEARVEPFLFAMDREMKAADLVVCRAGATTLAELAASGKASILVPLPTAPDDHQRRNALALVTHGAARMVEQRELSGDRIAAELLALAGDQAQRRRMEEAARQMARPDAARVIVDKVLALAR